MVHFQQIHVAPVIAILLTVPYGSPWIWKIKFLKCKIPGLLVTNCRAQRACCWHIHRDIALNWPLSPQKGVPQVKANDREWGNWLHLFLHITSDQIKLQTMGWDSRRSNLRSGMNGLHITPRQRKCQLGIVVIFTDSCVWDRLAS